VVVSGRDGADEEIGEPALVVVGGELAVVDLEDVDLGDG
jgi:hypothetical protein